MMNTAVERTKQAKVYDVALKTPLQKAAILSSETGAHIYLKREDLQPVHSFKIRGAYNKIANLSQQEKDRGVICASAGNHAQGVALSAQKLGISAVIVMPRTTPAIKVEAVKGYGAEVVLSGDSYSEAFDHSQTLMAESGRTFIHPFDDELVIAGQGTIGLEILEQLPHVTHIFVCVGGGGMLAGIAQYAKALRPDIKIIGVEPEDSNAMQVSLAADKRVVLDHVGIFADGVAVKQVGELTFDIAKKNVDEMITVTNDQICAAIKSIYLETRAIVEPAGALGVAGIQEYSKEHDLSKATCVAICSGANMTFERLQFVAERTLLGSGKEALFAVTLPEKPGALHAFCSEVIGDHSISEFSYRLNRRSDATIFIGINLRDSTDKEILNDSLNKYGYKFKDLSEDDLAKEHIRHMIGGKSHEADDEQLFEIIFPERPKALQDFLITMGDEWNICLFHYRGQGLDTGSVVVGFESETPDLLVSQLKKTGYTFTKITSVSASLFL
jgi:threonine dehydratase